jgi:hypothetical protein
LATSSYPSDGIDGLTITDWADFFNSRDGAADNYVDGALALTRIDSGNVCRISAGNVDINGYRLQVQTDTDLTCPTPSSGSATYFIVGYYDPNLNVADAGGNSPSLGPCRLALFASTDIDTTLAGKAWVLLHSVVRSAGQALTAAVVASYVHWLGGPTVEWPLSQANPPTGSYLAPRGTFRAAMDKRSLLIRTSGTGGALAWVDLLNAGPFAFPAPSSLVANNGTPQYFVHSGVMVKCRGTLKRSTGTLSVGTNDVTLGTFPVGFRPLFTERYLCKTGSGKNYVEVRVGPDGSVTMTGETGVDWIDISPINFRAEN